MDIRFAGKRALVTGGSRGIGREIAEKLVLCGAKTFILTKSASSVEKLRHDNTDIEVIQVDIADWDCTRRAVEGILPIDYLVNNAGINCPVAFIDASVSDIDDVFNINYKAVFNISQIVARGLITRKQAGAIVNISSVTSITHPRNASVYGSSKAALDSITKYMALELGSHEIRVNAVNPTVIPTDMAQYLVENTEIRNLMISKIPLGRLGEKREVADAVLFLLSDYASFVNGAIVPVDGGHVL